MLYLLNGLGKFKILLCLFKYSLDSVILIVFIVMYYAIIWFRNFSLYQLWFRSQDIFIYWFGFKLIL